MWQFYSPEIVFGEDALTRLAELQGQRALLITDENMVTLGFVDQVEAQLQSAGLQSERFTGVEPDPSIETVRQAEAALTDYQPDFVIGLGGGSCLDAAKMAWFLYENPGVELAEVNPFTPFQSGDSQLIAIPTTSGTGAEVTLGVILTDTEEQSKIAIYARELQPKLALIDPSFIANLPAQITADTGLDALTHAVEAFASPWCNDFSDGLCLKAIDLLFTYLPRAYRDGQDMVARERVHNAATLAGLGMNNASIALAHALAHALGALFRYPHGRLVSLCLPYTIEYTVNGQDSRYGEIAHFLHLPAADEQEGATQLVEAIRDLAQQLNQPLTLEVLGIERAALEAALPDLITKTAEDKQMLTSRRIPDFAELEQLFFYMYNGQVVDF